MIRWLLRILLALVVLILLAWGGLVYQYSEVAGPDVPKWQLALFIAQEVGARLHCAVTGCPAELPEGMTLRDWAGPDLVPSTPVALDVDPWHRVYVAEGDRNQGGAEGNRRHMYWLEDDLASTSVEDRRAYYEKWGAAGRVEEPELFTKRADRALVIEDADGDGTADRTRELARWNDWVNGIFAGVLWHDRRVDRRFPAEPPRRLAERAPGEHYQCRVQRDVLPLPPGTNRAGRQLRRAPARRRPLTAATACTSRGTDPSPALPPRRGRPADSTR